MHLQCFTFVKCYLIYVTCQVATKIMLIVMKNALYVVCFQSVQNLYLVQYQIEE